jgi:hypothetical protein
MTESAEGELSSCGLEVVDFRNNCDCGIAVAEQHSFKSCGLAIAEVLPASCGIAIADSKKSCACPPLVVFRLLNTVPPRNSILAAIQFLLLTPPGPGFLPFPAENARATTRMAAYSPMQKKDPPPPENPAVKSAPRIYGWKKRAVLYGHLLSADTKWCELGMHLKPSYLTVGALFYHPGVVFLQCC